VEIYFLGMTCLYPLFYIFRWRLLLRMSNKMFSVGAGKGISEFSSSLPYDIMLVSN